MDTLTNGTSSYGGVGFIVLILMFFFFSKNNETPNGMCTDMTTACASGLATQTQLESSIRTETELCAQNTLILTNNEKTRDKMDEFRYEYQSDQLMQSRFNQQKCEFDNGMLRQQLATQAQFNNTNANIARIECNCLKNPPFYPYGCTPCPVTPCVSA